MNTPLNILFTSFHSLFSISICSLSIFEGGNTTCNAAWIERVWLMEAGMRFLIWSSTLKPEVQVHECFRATLYFNSLSMPYRYSNSIQMVASCCGRRKCLLQPDGPESRGWLLPWWPTVNILSSQGSLTWTLRSSQNHALLETITEIERKQQQQWQSSFDSVLVKCTTTRAPGSCCRLEPTFAWSSAPGPLPMGFSTLHGEKSRREESPDWFKGLSDQKFQI